jgi:hypothetical protein
MYMMLTASPIHQHLAEVLFVDDQINDKWVSARMRNTVQVVRAIEGDEGPRPPEESECGWLNRVWLSARELLSALGVVRRWPAKDHEAASFF